MVVIHDADFPHGTGKGRQRLLSSWGRPSRPLLLEVAGEPGLALIQTRWFRMTP